MTYLRTVPREEPVVQINIANKMFNDPNPNPNPNVFSCVAGWFRK